MFTGIIEEIGKIVSIRKGAKSAVLAIEGPFVLQDAKVGDSIAVNGICLTATTIAGNVFTADVMAETMRRTALGNLRVGSPVNLERAMAANGRFGGHIVSGHIDGTGTITDMRQEENAVWVTIAADASIMRYIIEKGSIAIDGISLTVAAVSEKDFQVSVIPHTRQETTLLTKKAGDLVNLENDVVGKYVEHLMRLDAHEGKSSQSESHVDMGFLAEHGFL